jgi:peroxiredoxin
MARLLAGSKAPTMDAVTIGGHPALVPDTLGRLVHLQFRRFAGCPVCNFHLMTMARRRSEIQEAGVQQIVLFHSTAGEMMNYQAQLPFDCVADADMHHFRRWGVESSFGSLLHPRVLLSGGRWVLGQRRFFRKAENGVLGLPADFLVDGRGVVLASKYGKHADDQWEVDELLSLASLSRRQ